MGTIHLQCQAIVRLTVGSHCQFQFSPFLIGFWKVHASTFSLFNEFFFPPSSFSTIFSSLEFSTLLFSLPATPLLSTLRILQLSRILSNGGHLILPTNLQLPPSLHQFSSPFASPATDEYALESRSQSSLLILQRRQVASRFSLFPSPLHPNQPPSSFCFSLHEWDRYIGLSIATILGCVSFSPSCD